MELLERWCAGDAAAGNLLFKQHFTTLYRFFELKTDREVDDLVQETFLQALHSRDSFRRQSTFRTYLLAIARHVLFGHWRKLSSNKPTIDFEEVSIASLSTSAGSRMARGEDHARLMIALRTLPLDQQLLLEMYYWHELDRDQLAEVFDVETATIGSRLFRARQALQTLLGGNPQGVVDDDGLDRWARSFAG
jgi:RNA polymerase sigma-70 factor (ECF subfamily)